MSLSEKEVRKVAKLARIRIDDKEVEHFQQELNSIFSWIDTLQEVNTKDVPHMSSVSNISLPLRKDEVTDGDVHEQVLANAPMSNFGCYMVPKVVDEG